MVFVCVNLKKTCSQIPQKSQSQIARKEEKTRFSKTQRKKMFFCREQLSSNPGFSGISEQAANSKNFFFSEMMNFTLSPVVLFFSVGNVLSVFFFPKKK